MYDSKLNNDSINLGDHGIIESSLKSSALFAVTAKRWGSSGTVLKTKHLFASVENLDVPQLEFCVRFLPPDLKKDMVELRKLEGQPKK